MAGHGFLRWRSGLLWLWWLTLSLSIAAERPPRLPAPTLPPTLRMGVFTLFQLRSVQLHTHERPTPLRLDGRTVELHPRTTYRVARTADGLGVWHAGGLLTATTRLTVTADDVTVEAAGRKTRIERRFRGTLTITPVDDRLQLVVTLPLETATASVVSAELPPDAPVEAGKALAVVVRSYLVAQVGRHQREGFDVCDSTHCQLFLGEQWVRRGAAGEADGALSELGKTAAEKTAGEVLRTTDGGLYPAYFAACCGGRTTTPETAFGNSLKPHTGGGVPCEWCKGSRFYVWTRQVDRMTLAKALLPDAAATDDVRIEVAGRSPDGFVTSVSVAAGARQISLPNHHFRHIVGRRLGWNLVLSSRYTIESQGERVVIEGRGFGHHVGLCLAGALAQAHAGHDYRAILKYYFPKATCGNQRPLSTPSR
ncbi:MAG: SpoIID/LytB domain-containing protein [Chloracidobacterium sp.]|nr:SpoIID/LytB domain-containing protein [Chloracidobacterium sp.]MDW8217778.1 SpoIID/LytB domain-containing protein [Acidobacteriota bacterium]